MSPGIMFDCSSEPWVGRFPGLGCVQVDRDGAIEVDVEPSPLGDVELVDARFRALRYGWGEPLSLVRRGFICGGGAAVAPPGRVSGCVLLSGDPHDCTIMLIELAKCGWEVLSERIVPLSWEGTSLLAHHRDTPVLASRHLAEMNGLEARPIRANSDAVEIDIARCASARKVSAVAVVRRRSPGQEVLKNLVGHERFEASSRVCLGGVFAQFQEDELREEAQQSLSQGLRLAALPYALIAIDKSTLEQDTTALIEWLQAQLSNGQDSRK